MKKIFVIMFVFLLGYSITASAQEKSQKNQNTSQEQAKKNDASSTGNDKPSQADKVVPGKKGPDGQPVYEGPKGGQYYMTKGGTKTYLKPDDNVVAGKKGPDGQAVYAGPKGGQYYFNKKGDKVYLTQDKK